MSKKEALRQIKKAAETGATELDLSFQELTELPPELFRLTNLTTLFLFGNQLTELPPELFQLNNLTSLDLLGNQLTALPPELFQLNNLTSLLLDRNQLTSLPPEIAQLPKLEWLEVSDNPLISPPYELAVQGISAIREYFAEVEGETKEVAEVKVILVGEGASGKTSLVKQLHGGRFDPHEATTHGIRIKQWQPASSCQQIRCNLWDFGGQEIMHATHQFFLSRRSLYVLVLDGRRDERPEYWLRYIESFGGSSPVLVVLNKWDANPGFDLNRPFLQEKYPFIKGFWRTSCNTGQGVEPFKQALLDELNNVPLTKNRWPATWFRAKAMLERMSEPRISYEKFEGILAEAGVKGATTRNVLGDFLHDLGIVIHFKEFALDDNHVLDPKWVTGAVYKIINAPMIAEAKGLLKLDDLKEILQWQEGDEYKYWPADHVYVISLMKKFELCYELNANEVLIPNLLGVSEPSFEFDYGHALRFELRYEDFLPPSVMPRFIVKRHHEIKDKLRWRTGVVLANPMLEATAVIKADNEARRIHIAVTGKERKVFLALIWLTLREINSGFEGLKVSERVPMPDNPANSVPYKTLITYREKGLPSYIPEDSEEVYSVQELLDSVHLDNADDGEKMRSLMVREKKEGKLRRAAKAMNRYFELKPNAIGVGFNFNALFDDLLRDEERQDSSG
jgi:small GTP-binding protein